ncbi:MAG: cellulase family glycosylhydrolase [Phycisphaeraceae bacterium]|nr:cellulase family glycosylhydrolase [Phycisphaeraceae bacterium]
MTCRLTDRREFLKTAGAVAAGVALGTVAQTHAETKLAQTAIPRWRGFNLVDFFQAFDRGERSAGMVSEDDLKWIRDWGFDFIRLPMDYWLWIDTNWRETRTLAPDDMVKIKESMMERVDRTIEIGLRYGLHVSLNLHRAPGYCINNPDREPFVLWSDSRAEDAFAFHWDLFAKRYRNVSAKHLSFNLVNEAPGVRQGYMSAEDYRRVMTRATEAIRKHTPDRIIIIDGLSVGNRVVENMIPTGVVQSVHAYTPAGISHYRASWVDKNQSFPTPTWPLLNKDGSVKYDRAKLEAHYAPWAELAKKGIGVHCGEAGCYSKTPYDVFYAWYSDVMDILKGHGIGYALWNFRGSFGILDSGRTDIELEDWHGHKLDRRLLTLLQRS